MPPLSQKESAVADRIVLKDLPAKKHDDFLDEMEAKVQKGFRLVTDRMIEELLRHLRVEGLAKSDMNTVLKLLGTSRERGALGEIPRVEMDLSFASSLMDKYVAAIKWMLMGKSAGKDAEKWVELLGLKNRLPVGVVFGTFLHAVDVQRQFYEKMNGRSPAKVNEDSLKYTLDFVNNHTAKWADQSLLGYRNKMLQNLQDRIAAFNNDNQFNVHKEYHALLEEKDKVASQIRTIEDRQALVRESMKNVMEHKMSLGQMRQQLRDTTKDYGKDWDRLISTEFTMASGAGTHMAIQETFGHEDDEMRVSLVNVRDTRCCDTCESLSRNGDGSLKVYSLGEVNPPGYNFNKKRSEWGLVATGIHPLCRCTVVYIPKGFDIDRQGHIFVKGKAG